MLFPVFWMLFLVVEWIRWCALSSPKIMLRNKKVHYILYYIIDCERYTCIRIFIYQILYKKKKNTVKLYESLHKHLFAVGMHRMFANPKL